MKLAVLALATVLSALNTKYFGSPTNVVREDKNRIAQGIFLGMARASKVKKKTAPPQRLPPEARRDLMRVLNRDIPH